MNWARTMGHVLVVLVGLWVITGTALNLSRHPHWYVRGWDFPRTIVAGLAAASGALYAASIWDGRWYDVAFLAAVSLALVWQLVNIRPYTPLARRMVEDARRPSPECTLRLVIANVLQDNRDHVRFLEVVEREDPDLVLALEVDEAWERELRPLEARRPHLVKHVLDNCYGIALYSRLPLHEPRVAFLVQDDIPSVHARVELPSGVTLNFHGLHPRPPEPLNDQSSAPRDAELLKVARWIREADGGPTVVAGDLNDVAWSHTTNLFLKESGLLDPRIGRGFYNSFDARNPVIRFPLDHVFHSAHFRLVELRRLDKVGSDHFPMLVALSHEPDAAREQEGAEASPADEREVEERIEKGEREEDSRSAGG